MSILFLHVLRDVAVCQQPGRGLPRLVWGPDDLSRLYTEWRCQHHPKTCHSNPSDSPDSPDTSPCCLPELRWPGPLRDTVSPVFTPHPSPHSRTDPLPDRRLLSAAAGDPHPTAPPAAASGGPAHPASAPTDDPAHHPGINHLSLLWHRTPVFDIAYVTLIESCICGFERAI